MNHDPSKPVDEAERARPDESFLQRFHRRKQEARLTEGKSTASAAQDHQPRPLDTQQDAPAPELTDADMPPIESLTVDSDYSGFLSAKVSESLRRAALRKLFHSGELNVIDGLDDYAEDFTTFTALGDFVTADMRHRIAIEAKKKAEAVTQAVLEDQETPGEIEAAQTDAHPDRPAETGIGDAEPPTHESEST